MIEDRKKWIDTLKAVAITLVVIGHYVDTPVVKAFIYSFHMHLFFMISGFLYRKKDTFGNLVIKRSKTLLLPYFIFSFIQYIFFLLRRRFGDSPDLSVSVLQKFIDIFTWNEFWFLGVLFVVSLSFYFIADKIRLIKSVLIFIAGYTMAHWLVSIYLSDVLPENLIKCLPASVFYCVGYYLRDKIKYDTFYDLNPIKIVGTVAVIATVFTLSYRQYGLININFHGNYLYYYILAVGGVFLTTMIAQHIKDNTILSFVGANTILFYLLEGYPPAIVRRFIKFVYDFDNFNSITFGYAIIYSIATILILVPFILFINRHTPFVIGRRR